eukprot:15004215-Alexandrium_andersonii.AAC.1
MTERRGVEGLGLAESVVLQAPEEFAGLPVLVDAAIQDVNSDAPRVDLQALGLAVPRRDAFLVVATAVRKPPIRTVLPPRPQ